MYLTKKLFTEAKKETESYRDTLRDVLSPLMEEYQKQLRTGITILENTELSAYPKKGFAVLNFGNGVKLNSYIQEERVIFFTFKELQRETLPLKLVSKNELATFLDIDKKEVTLHVIAKKLNSMVNKNKLVVNTGKDFLVASRSKTVDIELALDNILKSDDVFWGEKFQYMVNEIKRTKDDITLIDYTKEQMNKLESFLEKVSDEVLENFEENPYVKVQKGRVTFDRTSEEAFIEELCELNMDVALKISKEGTGKERLVVLGEFSKEECGSVSKNLKKLLDRKYSDKQEYLSQIENEGEIELTTILKR